MFLTTPDILIEKVLEVLELKLSFLIQNMTKMEFLSKIYQIPFVMNTGHLNAFEKDLIAIPELSGISPLALL